MLIPPWRSLTLPESREVGGLTLLINALLQDQIFPDTSTK
jgi:hypothetical protein